MPLRTAGAGLPMSQGHKDSPPLAQDTRTRPSYGPRYGPCPARSVPDGGYPFSRGPRPEPSVANPGVYKHGELWE